jgi:aryl carrier-like protein
MIPSFFVFIDKIPITPNGKIYRQSLPELDFLSHVINEQFVEPTHFLEKELFIVWSEIFRTKHIGIYDNFFKLGGDSFISIQMVAKARARGISFSVKDVFNYPTIYELASIVGISEPNLNDIHSSCELVSSEEVMAVYSIIQQQRKELTNDN